MKGSAMKKIAVLFPGIGYHTDKPLLYYSKKLAKNAGYEIREIQYSGFESKGKIRGNRDGMIKAFETAYRDTKKQLDAKELRRADVLFISKSIGTVAACAFAKEENIPARQILYTPVEETFRFIDMAPAEERTYTPAQDPARGSEGTSVERHDIVVFHGTADQWVDSPIVVANSERLRLPIHIYADGNHSIETGDVDTDLANLRDIMRHTKLFIEKL